MSQQPPAELGVSLSEALRYVAAWRGKRVVVKLGGRVLDQLANPTDLGTWVQDLVLLQRAGLRVVLVHGGGPEISRLLDRLGMSAQFLDGLRVTDSATMEVVEMVLAGRVNKRLVGLIQEQGGRVVGLSGKDAAMLQAVPHPRSQELGFVGEVQRVDTAVLTRLFEGEFIPVVASLGVGPGGATYNLNADTAASALAVALRAQKLILLTDVKGVFHGDRLLSQVAPRTASELLDAGIVSSGMIPKVKACLAAVRGGVPSAHVIGADQPHGLLVELLTETGIGTLIRAEQSGSEQPVAESEVNG